MEALHFAHQFFQFSPKKWLAALGEKPPSQDFLRQLFREPILPWRELKGGSVRSFKEAEGRYSEIRKHEQACGIRAIAYNSPEYPEAIRKYIPQERHPSLIYLRGTQPPAEEEVVAVVGTRGPSQFGMDCASSFSSYFTALQIRIISGLARGIDAIAHQRGLEIGTIAILGSDVSSIYPTEHQELAEKILQKGGSLLSPFPTDQVPLPHNFPIRNEIIAALATGILVVEGAEKSGAAITGRAALAMGKTVVTLAQDYRSAFGRGAIRLQQDGAVLVANEAEAIEAFYQRLGGRQKTRTALPTKRFRGSFTFRDFQQATKLGVTESLALLQQGLMEGKFEREGALFRLR